MIEKSNIIIHKTLISQEYYTEITYDFKSKFANFTNTGRIQWKKF